MTASSGREAVASVLSNDFAVILLDVMMPEMDGFKTASRIREVEAGRNTPIIFVTAHREFEAQLHKGNRSGAVDFLYKPIDPEVLRFKVSVFANLQRQADLLKKYSTQLQDANAALEQRVEQRTAELRASNEELRQFAYVASHDLKEPLRTITTFAEILSQRYKGRLDSAADEFIHHLVQSTRRMDLLLDEAPRIQVSAELGDGEWLFSVRDNGLGIDPRYHDQIFGIFKRVHGKEYPGNGIGLSVCKKIVERRHGRIWVESEPDQGSTFYFTLPNQQRG